MDQVRNILMNLKADTKASEALKQFGSSVKFEFNPTELMDNLTGLAEKPLTEQNLLISELFLASNQISWALKNRHHIVVP